jgi:tellurium resistance protein TerD
MSAVTLTKGVPVKLSKEDGSAVSLKSVHIGAGWDVSRTKSKYDLDLIVLMLKSAKEKVVQDQANGNPGVIYFGDMTSYCGSIKLDKDNRDGAGDGYDENVYTNLETIPLNVNCLPICINIYQGVEKGQTFGQVENAFIEVNVEGLPPLKVDLTEDHAAATLVHVADLYRGDDGVWKLKKIELGIESGFAGLMQEYGVKTQ